MFLGKMDNSGMSSVWWDWIYLTLGNFSKPVATISLPKSPTFLGKFCKGVKIFNFSSELIFGQLLWTFGDFLLVTLDVINIVSLLSSTTAMRFNEGMQDLWQMLLAKQIDFFKKTGRLYIILVFNSDVPGLNPDGVHIFTVKLSEKNNVKEKEAGK